MNDPEHGANSGGATRRDLIAGVAGGIMLPSMSSTAMATATSSPVTDTEQLLAIEGIKYRKARYAYCVDNKDAEGFGANFTEDAVWDISGHLNPRDPNTGKWTGVSDLSEEFIRSYTVKAGILPVVGRTNITNAVKKGWDQNKNTSAHKLFNPMIDILSASQARAIWPFEDESYSPPPRPFRYLNGVGYYHETYAKVGRDWLISSVKVKRTFLVLR
ncbi:nuclear transport factor 2 family protein [Sphingobium sp. AN641]|uniref:nuclear transport factor 2 family protein n=1 Tax=Sphingobium sp. AN641 TaxID=3133443 RepID=UPI0030BB71D0